MASIRERTRSDGKVVFNVQVRMQGFPARTASFPTRRQAERWATTIEAEMIEGKHFRGVEARRRTLGEAIDQYLRDEVPKKKGGGGMHKAALRWWKERLGHLKLAEVTSAKLSEQRSKLSIETFSRTRPGSKRSLTRRKGFTATEKKRAPNTVNRYLSVLSHVFTIARKEWQWIQHDPFDGVAKLKTGKGRDRYLSEDERSRLLEETAKDKTLHLLVIMALSTAARAGELIRLQWKDVDLNHKEGSGPTVGRVLFRDTKNTETRAVWIYGEAYRLLKEHSKVRHLTKHEVFPKTGKRFYDYSDDFSDALKAAKIENFRFHDLRHSAATYLAMQGATEQQLRAIGGWKSNVVSRYVHLAATDAKVALERLSEKIGRK